MGTRNLTMVQLNNEIKVAQYGQWDGYPKGQGLTVLEFCKDKNNLAKLKERLVDVSFLDDEKELDRLNDLLEAGDTETTKWYDTFISRNICAEILKNIVNSTGQIKIHNRYKFGYDGLFCEWAYLVNLDTNKLEVYCGFTKMPLKKSERFYKENPNDDGYYGIRLIKEYDLSNLPNEDDYVEELERKAQ